MSFYEKATLICSAFAIILSIFIPLLQFAFKKMKRLKISIVPFETNSLNLLFNESGSYFKFSFCIACQNKPTTISSMHAKIIKKSDNSEKIFNWSSFESVYINWFGNNSANRINSVSYARPYKINADILEPFIIEFSNTDFIDLRKLCDDRDQKLLRYVQFGEKQFTTLNDLHKSYVTLDEYHTLCDAYKDYLFWTPDDYELILNLNHDIKKKKVFKYKFSINENDYSLLCKNQDSIIFGQLYKQANQSPLPFNTILKSL